MDKQSTSVKLNKILDLFMVINEYFDVIQYELLSRFINVNNTINLHCQAPKKSLRTIVLGLF